MAEEKKTCWQYEIKMQQAIENNWDIPVSHYNELTICPVEYKTAKNFIIQYEWVGNMGTSKYCFGLFFSKNLAAVVTYGPLVTPSKYKKILGEEYSNRVLQLCRGASTYWAPKWAPSKLISQSLKEISKNLQINVVVAYSDPLAGEIGTIYQACNAYYLGFTSPGGSKRYMISGHIYDPKKVQKKFGSRAKKELLLIDPNYSEIPQNAKHRYFFLLGSKKEKTILFEKIKPLIKPYPKRM